MLKYQVVGDALTVTDIQYWWLNSPLTIDYMSNKSTHKKEEVYEFMLIMHHVNNFIKYDKIDK